MLKRSRRASRDLAWPAGTLSPLLPALKFAHRRGVLRLNWTRAACITPVANVVRAMGGQRWDGSSRPEATEGGGSAHYQEQEAARYTTTPQTIQIQKEMTQRAVQLLCLSVSAVCATIKLNAADHIHLTSCENFLLTRRTRAPCSLTLGAGRD